MTLDQVAVLIPLHFTIAMSYLNETDPTFQKSTGHQALSTKIFRDRIIDTVELKRRLRFTRQILNLRHGGLHSICQFKGIQSSAQGLFPVVFFEVIAIHGCEQIELFALSVELSRPIVNVLDTRGGCWQTRIPDGCPLAMRWQERRSPIVHPSMG